MSKHSDIGTQRRLDEQNKKMEELINALEQSSKQNHLVSLVLVFFAGTQLSIASLNAFQDKYLSVALIVATLVFIGVLERNY